MLRVVCQPDGPVKGIAKACGPALRQAKARGAELFVLVIDREQQQESVGALATVLKGELEKAGPWPFKVEVVFKDRTFENWLVADVQAVREQRGRFDLTQSAVRKVEPDKADHVDALAILQKAAKGKQYEKIEDGRKIAGHLDLSRAAKNSRSLRHMLHVLGVEAYADQCRRPI